MEKLTKLEMQVLKVWVEEICSYDNAEDLKADNFSWTDVKDLSEHTGQSVKTIKGVVGSLVKKGLADTDIGGENNPILSLSEEGIDAAYDIK